MQLIGVLVPLLFTIITGHDAAFYDHQILCHHSGGMEFNVLCNPYEFNPAYYPGAQELALKATTCDDDPHQLGKCLDTPYGGEGTGIELWVHHYASCDMEVQADCGACLDEAAQVIRRHCRNRIGAQAASANCCARYEQYRFC